jgi:serine/threonine-protein kinase
MRAGPGSAELPRSLFDYEVLDFIGEGAGSVIYVVAHPESRQICAMKYVVKRREKDTRFFEQLENEFNVTQQFAHPILRRSLEMRDNRTLFRKPTEAALVMEMFDGVSLEQHRPQETLSVLSIFIQVTQGLGVLHAGGYAHCDLKPNNILVNSAGQAKIIDFGQACTLGATKERIQGTPDFIAPEQVRCQPITVRTDVFNLGATLYWTLAGRCIPTLYTLKKDENSFLVDDRITTPHEINPAVPENLSNLVMDCIRTNPAKRPADMAELQRRLETIQHAQMRRAAVA